MQYASYRIPTENLPLLDRAFAKVNQRIAKFSLDCQPFSYERLHDVAVKDARGGRKHVRSYTWVTVRGASEPKYNGWSLCARYDFDQGAVIAHTVPGVELPREWWTVDNPTCDHCGYRRHRNATFLLRHEDGTYKVVGRQCIKDFLGHQGIGDIVRALDWVREALGSADKWEEDGWPGQRRVEYADALETMAYTCGVARIHGWVSATRARNAHPDSKVESTGWLVNFVMGPRPQAFGSSRNVLGERWDVETERCNPTPEDRRQAHEIIDLVKAIKAPNEYQFKLQAIAKVETGMVALRDMALWVSAYTVLLGEQRRREKVREQAEVPPVVAGRQENPGRGGGP